MIELERLKEIVFSLTEIEIKYLMKNMFSKSNENTSKGVSGKLLQIIFHSHDIDFEDLSFKLYKRVNKSGLKKLIQRLTEKILDFLSCYEVIIANDLYDSRTKEVFYIRRKLMHYDILVMHGVTNYALTILDQSIISAKRIEKYDLLLKALERKLIKMSLKNGLSKYKKVYDEIKFYSDCNNSLNRARYYFRLYASNFKFKQIVFLGRDIENVIIQVQSDYERTKSKEIKYVLYYLRGIKYSGDGDYIKNRENFKNLYKQIDEKKWNVRYTLVCLLNIGLSETMLYNFESSLQYISKINLKKEKNIYNRVLINEVVFMNYLYSGKIELAKQFLKKLFNNVKNSKFINAKPYYYKAAIYTLDGLYVESNKELLNCNQLISDKDGWNLGHRILSIINNIELEKLSLVEAQVENLRKHISRIEGDNAFFNRSKIICKLLISIVHNSYDFKTVDKKLKESLSLIGSNDANYKWIINTPEIIIFHEWFESKVKGIPYDHVEVMKRLKKQNKVKK